MPTFSRTQTLEHSIGERGRFALKVTSADVVVHAVPGDTARVRGTFEIRASSEEEADRIFESIQLRVLRDDGSLQVTERDEPSLGSTIARLFSGSRFGLDLSVDVPTRAEVALEGVSADMQVTGLLAGQEYATVSGDLFLTELGGDVRVNSVSGDVTLRAIEEVSLRANTVSGDLSVTGPRLLGLGANSVSGDVDIEGELAGDGTYHVETVSGDLTVGLIGGATFEVRGLSTDIRSDLDHRIEGQRDRRRLVVGNGGPRFQFSSMSGDVSVRRPRRADRRRETVAALRASGADQMAVLQALERGEIDVDEAARRLSGDGPDA